MGSFVIQNSFDIILYYKGERKKKKGKQRASCYILRLNFEGDRLLGRGEQLRRGSRTATRGQEEEGRGTRGTAYASYFGSR